MHRLAIVGPHVGVVRGNSHLPYWVYTTEPVEGSILLKPKRSRFAPRPCRESTTPGIAQPVEHHTKLRRSRDSARVIVLCERRGAIPLPGLIDNVPRNLLGTVRLVCRADSRKDNPRHRLPISMITYSCGYQSNTHNTDIKVSVPDVCWRCKAERSKSETPCQTAPAKTK